MENSFITALSMSVMAAAATSLGIYTIRRYAQWGQHNASYFMCFAAGIIISASFLHIIPKSLSMNSSAPGYILAGFFVLHVFNRFVTAFVCEKNSVCHPDQRSAIGCIAVFVCRGAHLCGGDPSSA